MSRILGRSGSSPSPSSPFGPSPPFAPGTPCTPGSPLSPLGPVGPCVPPPGERHISISNSSGLLYTTGRALQTSTAAIFPSVRVTLLTIVTQDFDLSSGQGRADRTP